MKRSTLQLVGGLLSVIYLIPSLLPPKLKLSVGEIDTTKLPAPHLVVGWLLVAVSVGLIASYYKSWSVRPRARPDTAALWERDSPFIGWPDEKSPNDGASDAIRAHRAHAVNLVIFDFAPSTAIVLVAILFLWQLIMGTPLNA